MLGNRINIILLKYCFAFVLVFSLVACGDSSVEQALKKEKNTIIITSDNAGFNAIKGLMMRLQARGGSGSFRWSVGDESKATLTGDGQFTGLQVGKVEVTAVDSEGHSGKVTLVISDAELQFISISPNNESTRITSGDSKTYTAVAIFSNETSIDITGQATWSTDTPASISFSDPRGTVSSKYGFVGDSVITVSFRDKTTTTTLLVEKPVVLVTGTDNVKSATVGSTLQMSASGIVSGEYRWSVDDIYMGNIDNTGLLSISPSAVSTDITVKATDVDNADFYGMAIISIPQGINVKLTGELMDGDASKVAIQDNFAYVLANTTFSIVNISDPDKPSQVAYLDMIYATDIAVSGKYAYVAGAGLRIIDISDASAPVVVGVFLETNGSSIAIRDAYAYLVGGSNLEIINISNPTAPTLIGALSTTGFYADVDIYGDYVYLAGNFILRIIDIRDPTAPVEVGSIDTPGSASAVAISGNHAYVADTKTVRIINISDPTSPVETGAIGRPGSVLPARDVTVNGKYAYVAGDGLRIFNISDPFSPIEVGAIPGGLGIGISVTRGNLALLADQVGGLRIIDISTPSLPIERGRLYNPTPHRITINGDHAYGINFHGALQIINISATSAPVMVGEIDLSPSYPPVNAAISTKNDFAYVVSGNSGLSIINITDPATPTEIGKYSPSGFSPQGVALTINNDYAYVATGKNGLSILDLRVPSSPVEVAAVNTIGTTQNVVINGNYAYVAGRSGLFIIDISKPAAPNVAGSYDTQDLAALNVNVGVSENFAYVIAKRPVAGGYIIEDGNSSLLIINTSDPTAPTLEGSYDTLPGLPSGVTISGSYVYVANNVIGLHVIDISIPTTPLEVGMYNTPGNAVGIASNSGYIFVADSIGFGIYEFIAP